MSGKPQMSAVDRSAGMFTSIAARGRLVPLQQVFASADEHGMSAEQVIDALAFLEAAGMIGLQTMVEVLRAPPAVAEVRAS